MKYLDYLDFKNTCPDIDNAIYWSEESIESSAENLKKIIKENINNIRKLNEGMREQANSQISELLNRIEELEAELEEKEKEIESLEEKIGILKERISI